MPSEVAGYVQQVATGLESPTVSGAGLTRVMIRGAGHIVPGDQPERALDMIVRFIEGKPFSV